MPTPADVSTAGLAAAAAVSVVLGVVLCPFAKRLIGLAKDFYRDLGQVFFICSLLFSQLKLWLIIQWRMLLGRGRWLLLQILFST